MTVESTEYAVDPTERMRLIIFNGSTVKLTFLIFKCRIFFIEKRALTNLSSKKDKKKICFYTLDLILS